MEYTHDLPISETEITSTCSSTMSLTIKFKTTDFVVQVNQPTDTATTQKEKKTYWIGE